MARISSACWGFIVAATAIATPALAADLPQPPPPLPQAPAAYIPPPPPVYNWGGIYFGLNGGYGFGNSEWSPASGTGTGNFNVSGGLVGGTLGANFQSGEFVFGVEGDLDWTDIKGNVSSTTICPSGGTTSCTFQTENDWLATLRGRFGYAFDRVLVYGTAGGAFGNIKPQLSVPPIVGSSNSTEFGWTAGAGLEFALALNWTARIEYLFVDLSKGSFSCGLAQCTSVTTVPVSFDASLVRIGLDYKFGGGF
jgi:outer membrane immunogenic protein